MIFVFICISTTAKHFDTNYFTIRFDTFFFVCLFPQKSIGNDSAGLATVNAELAKNPYCDLLEYRSTAECHFTTDVNGKRVNRYQKPLCVYLQLLKMFAHPGATVLDLTMGTGSLELAAMEPSAPRNLIFIAYEKNEYQIKNAELRLIAARIKPTDKAKVLVDVQEELHMSQKDLP